MPVFVQGAGTSRKIVKIEVQGSSVAVTEKSADGKVKRGERSFQDETQASKALEKMSRELVARGFVEQAPPAPKPQARTSAPPEPTLSSLFDEADEEPVGEVLPRINAAPAAATAEPKPAKTKKKSGKKKRKKKADSGDNMEKKATVAIFGIGAFLVLFLGWFVYDGFFKPASIVGDWKGSKLEHEISRSLSNIQYALSLDSQHHAHMVIQDEFPASGTYAVKGNRIDLALTDEDGDSFNLQYKFVLGRATLDLYDIESGEKVVQLIRQSTTAPKAGSPPPPPAEPNVAEGPAVEGGDTANDEKLASVAFAPKDAAFRLRHPPGWTPETGSRPDNTYSWARFTQGSNKIQIFADTAGSLMSGSDVGRQYPEGSEFAPVHNAHMMALKTAREEFSDYSESKPTLFKGSGLGEGRIASFNASAGGLFGGKLQGYRVTLLTRNRRVTVLCSCPEADFKKLEPTFLAVCRSLTP